MYHIDENRLLAYVLEVLDCDADRNEIAEHLHGCPECSAQLERIRGDVQIISSIQPYARVLQMSNPRGRRRRAYAILRAPVMIVLGVFVGFGIASLVRNPPTEVVPQYVVLSPPDGRSPGSAATDVTEVPLRYYEDLLGKQE